ncbi:hypothetical protein, conserved [Eimeria tenella]|uniref:Aldehyde dehydrogenase n=1 Tax=Eimeria tenella TaxID=5802 RepID=U6KGF3_EIMTE|nr:hypothetical protein, conserved [Eimeria tenella]CDJ37125.1 hypothetical protein, conserved [Eimeria tenella]|eukprot:XP_013227963.1 hypothetical protein, conserved [Eimeria tenella]
MENKDISAVVERVAATKAAWAALPPQQKLELLDKLMDNLNAHGEDLHAASVFKRDGDLKDAPAYSALSAADLQALQNASRAQHWLHSSMLVSNWLSIIREYFEAVVKTGAPPPPLAVREAPAEEGKPQRHIVKVGPSGLLHTTLVTCGSLELMVEGPVEQELLHERPPGVAAVLGAGNFDGPVDLLTSLFIENKVCIYKLSPFNARLLEPLEKIFAPLLEANFAAFIFGGVEEAKALLHHPQVDKWFMTGAAATAYSIIWGSPEPQQQPAEPLFKKPMTVELGNCTPWIVCPGKWSRRQLKWHAAAIAASMAFNGAHICAHPQVLVTCKNWPQREEFLQLIQSYIQEIYYVGCYYPDFSSRMESYKEKLVAMGKKPEEFEAPVHCPISKDSEIKNIIFATDLPEDCFFTRQETFCPCCGEVPLDTEASIAAFLPAAVKFANEKVHGGLSVSISVKPSTAAEEQALELAVADLNYGAVHINIDTKMSIAFPSLVWGGCPGSTIYNLNSGIGFIGNCFGFKRATKSIIRAPFLNFSHVILAAPNGSNAAKMAKLWRRIAFASFQRRSTQGWFSFAGSLTKIASAFAANL